MLIELKGNNYYSKVFKRVNYKLSNSTFWVVIRAIKRKLESLYSNIVWVLIKAPKGIKLIGVSWCKRGT